MNILDIAIAKLLAGGGGTGTVTSVSVQGGSDSHLTGSGNPIETSGTITINVDEGYSIPSDDEQTAWNGKAADLKAEIDSSTYVMTLQLKDSAGNLIGSEKTIDLPLETMVVDGTYDPQAQKIKLELKNGNFVEFSVADLVSGLQTELSSSNKLNPDYIAYDASHRAVSDTEKDTWNGKQNAISDLETIRSGAAAGATAVQPSEMNSALATKQDTIDSSHKLASSLVSFGTAEATALASGIDSTKVEQIGTNQTNILYGLENGVKNTLLNPNLTGRTFTGITYLLNSDMSVTVSGTNTGSGRTVYSLNSDNTIYGGGTYTPNNHVGQVFSIGDVTTDNDCYTVIFYSNNGTSWAAEQTLKGASSLTIQNYPFYNICICVTNGVTLSSPRTFYPMICTQAAYTQSTAYQPPALTNALLTKEAINAVNNGVKNLLPDGENSVTSVRWVDYPISIPAGTYEVYIGTFSSDDTDSTVSQVYFFKNTTTLNPYTPITKKAAGMHATITTNDTSTFLRIYASSNATTSTGDSITLSKVMVCKKEDWDASPIYAPYALPNYDLTRLESEDRAALAEEIDAGAKQLANFTSTTNLIVNSNGYTIAVSGKPSSTANQWIWQGQVSKSGYYAFVVEGTSIPTTVLYNATDDTNVLLYNTSSGGKSIGYLSTGKTYKIGAYLNSSTTYNTSFNCMLCTKAAFGVSPKFVPYKYQSPTSIVLSTETFNVAAANTYYKIYEQFVGGDGVNRLYKISAAAMYAGARPAALKVTIQAQTAGSPETIAREITADTDVSYLSADYIFRTYGGTIRVYASYKAVTNKGAAYLIVDQYKV